MVIHQRPKARACVFETDYKLVHPVTFPSFGTKMFHQPNKFYCPEDSQEHILEH